MKKLFSLLIALLFVFYGCAPLPLPSNEISDEKSKNQISQILSDSQTESLSQNENISQNVNFDINSVPKYSGSAYVAVNGNVPFFTKDEIKSESFEYYSELDSLGRCGVTVASIGVDIMPTEPRGEIGMIKPTGWVSARYDFVDGKSLYNRCHLIGFQLSGENANRQNLITGTRYLNIKGMLPFENMVADYVKETENHVMYRVTPIFIGENLVASGVLMEGFSVEDDGEEICFCVYAYNVQPGVVIDYATGENWEEPENDVSDSGTNNIEYVLNTNSKKFHLPSCGSVEDISDKNRETTSKSRDDLIDEGYSPCGKCNP